MKICTRCKEEQSLANFRGRHVWCTSCRNEDNRARYAANIHKERARGAKWRAENREAEGIRTRLWVLNNPERTKAREIAWNAANRERRTALAKLWCINNPEKVKAKTNRWMDRNWGAVLSRNARRRAAKLRATPDWADGEKIKAVYEAASRLSQCMGDTFHVDHIVPLRSQIVCGLHTWENLQVLTCEENSKKGNRWWPDMPQQLNGAP